MTANSRPPITPPATALSPQHQRTLRRMFTRMRERAEQRAETIVNQTIGTVIIDPGTGTARVDLAGDVTGPSSGTVVVGLQHNPISSAAPSDGQALVWDADASMWVPGAPGDATGVVIDYSTLVNEALVGRGASASASSEAPLAAGGTMAAGNVIDENPNSAWESDPGLAPPYNAVTGAWVKVDLGSAKAITYVRYHGGGGQAGTPWVATWQSSTDNSTWTDRGTITLGGVDHYDTGFMDLGGAVTARYWRAILTTGPDPDDGSRRYTFSAYTLYLYSGTPLVQAPGHVIEDEGTPVLQRSTMNFVGDGVSAADSGGKTVVTVSTADHDHTASAGDGGVLTNDEHDGYSEYAEIGADPATPPANTLRLYALDKAGVSTLYYVTDDGTIYELPTLGSGGPGSGAPVDAHYITTQSELGLSSEVLLSAVIGYGLLSARPSPAIEGRLYYGSDTEVWYRDTGAAWTSLATGLDEKVKVSSNDTTPGYLHGKLVAGSGVTLTEDNDGANETLTIAATLSGSVLGYRAWTYTTFSAGEFTYVVDDSGNPVYSLQELE